MLGSIESGGFRFEGLGLDTPPADIGMQSARRLWRSIADYHDQSGVGGRSAQQLVGTLISALNYARRDDLVPLTDGIIHSEWRDSLRTDWLTRTGVSLADKEVSRESHTEQETAKIIDALPLADPRIRVAFPIGAGLRLGQMSANLTRRGVHEGGVFGLYVEFMDRKAAETVRIDLPPVAQRELRHAMEDGHLRKLEAAYQAGDIDDYFIVPGGSMKDGACQVRYCHEPLSRESVLKYFHKLEAAAGVEHIKGRSWHGLRRAFEALVARHTQDPNVKDRAGGWKIGGGTRLRIYMNKEGEELTEAAAHARAAALADVSSAASPAERTEDLSVQARLHLDLLAEAAEETGDTGLAEDVASATELIARIQKRAQELASEAAKQAGPRLTREELEARRHEETAAAIREEIERQELTGKAAAEITGVSPSYISAVVNGKSSGTVGTETLEEMLEALRASPETAD